MSRPARYSRCIHCGKEFKWKACNAGLYCSHECAADGQRTVNGKALVRVVHAEWRASRGCAVCGSTVLPILHAHHISPNTKRKNTKDINTVEELEYELGQCICLCSSHHDLWHYEEKRDGRGLTPEQMARLIRAKYRDTVP